MPSCPRIGFTNRLVALGVSLALLHAHASSATAQPAIEGYSDYAALAAQLKKLDESDLVTVESLGQTLGNRDVYLVTVGTGKPHGKPALLIVGNVHAPHLVGSEMAVRMIHQLVERAAQDEATKKLLDRYTLYVIPRPTPDASEWFLKKPYAERAGNERSTDDDRDFTSDEDPTEDLNGDGYITMLRVEDETGNLISHPGDERVLFEADAKKNERGRFKLLSEGRDNDEDEKFNEDGPGGVAFNRNFTFRYPYFQSGAGPNQVSEIESRAVANFCFTHSNIALVLTFTPEDNLMDTWKPNPGSEGERIKTNVLGADAEYLNYLAEQYRTIHGGKDAPASPKGEGSFSEWAYFHFGRWSLGARAWWIPKTAAPEAPKPPEGDKAAEEAAARKAKALADEKRGADDLNALNWFASEKVDGFIPWLAIEHPDFPGKKVSVGGFKPFLRLNPPARLLDELAGKHVAFLTKVSELLPTIKLAPAKVESLGGGVFRLTATAVNQGYLPTMSSMGKATTQPPPLQIKLELAEGMKLVTGSPRAQLVPLSGNGGKAEHTWLVLAAGAKSPSVVVRVWSPVVGEDRQHVELK